MKRIFLTIMAVLGALAISSCGKNDDNPQKNDNINNGGGNNTIPNTEEKQTIPSSYYVVSPDGKTLMQWFNTEATSIDMQNDKVLSKVTRITAFFGDCKKLSSIVLPESLESLKGYTFSHCESLTSITIPKQITEIKEYTFLNCKSLASIELSNITSIGEGAFLGAGLTSITIPNSVTSIGRFAFLNCKKLENVALPTNIEKLESNIFKDCISLSSITIPNRVKTIEDSAFYNTGLTSVIIPKGVQKIGTGAFGSCKKLITATIPKGVRNDKELSGAIFPDCEAFETLYLGSFLPNKEDSVKEVVLPEDITYIPKEAFCLWRSLTTISIPKWVNRIGEDAFLGCWKLKSITLEAETPPVLEKGSLSYFIQDIYVPKRSLQAYKESASWEEYANKIKARL